MSFVFFRNIFMGIILAISLIPIPCFAEDETLPFIPLLLSKKYGTVVSVGQIWLDRNIGASRVASRYNDLSGYGNLFQWGRRRDGHEKRRSSITSANSGSDAPGHNDFILEPDSPFDWRIPQNDNLWQGTEGINNPCPSGFRLPTGLELEVEKLSWSENNYSGAFASPLKFTLPGFRRNNSGDIFSEGRYSQYWSSTVQGYYARQLYISLSSAYVSATKRADGNSVRCIMDGVSTVNIVESSGQTWMDRNLGSPRAASQYDDEIAYGDLYQWGRGTDGHEKRASTTTSENSSSNTPHHDDFIIEASSPYDWRVPQNTNLWQGEEGVNNPCPSGLRLPTATELETERASWSDNHREGAFSSPLKLVAGGFRYSSHPTLGIIFADSYGYYWSSTIIGTTSRCLGIFDTNASVASSRRAHGLSVRCIKDGVSTVITVESEGKTWMDRNLGASRAATEYEDELAYGDLYQWGRGIDGHEKRTSDTTHLKSDSDTPGHGDFITTSDVAPWDWREPSNDSLWWAAGGINNPCPGGFRLPIFTELRNEMESWSSDDAAGAFDSPLRFVGAGYRVHTEGGALTNAGTTGLYWSSSTNGYYIRMLRIEESTTYMVTAGRRASGSSIRCIKD